ncbi:cytochrome C oxidase subunit IV family protein [Azospirillum sp. sgz302134]
MNATMTVLLRSWAILVGLTLVTMLVGGGGHGQTLGLASAAAVVAVTITKGWQILTHYMGLHGAGRGWRSVLVAYLLVVGAAILGAYAIGVLR